MSDFLLSDLDPLSYLLLESCRKYNREAKIIFAGTRGEYGSSVTLPVGEDHPTNPKGIYAVTNLSAEEMVLVYDDVHKIPVVCLRITNTYGPRHQMAHDEYGRPQLVHSQGH